jgi:hypothetical protein
MNRMDDKLDALWSEYRAAVPDPDAGPNFMPNLWQKIEARRSETATSIFRRMAQICVMATLAVALLLSIVLVPAQQTIEPFYTGSYVDILAAEHANDYTQLLPLAELQ